MTEITQYLKDGAPMPMEFQIEAVKKLISLSSGNSSEIEYMASIKGAILKAEMGLGKTLMAYLTISSTLNPDNPKLPSLVITSKSLIKQWKRESRKFFGGNMKVFMLHKNFLGEEINNIRTKELMKYDVILTTYEFIRGAVAEIGLKPDAILDNKQQIVSCKHPEPNDISKTKAKGGGKIFKINFENIFLDESHEISNRNTCLFKSVMCLCAKRYFCLTGTPVRNYTVDLFTQLCFIGYTGRFDAFMFHFNNPNNGLKNYIIDLDYERAGVKLPGLNFHKVNVKLSDEERKFYDGYAIYAHKLALRHKELASSSDILTQFTRLRQISIAAHLILEESKISKKACKEKPLNRKIIPDDFTRTEKWVSDVDGTAGINSSKFRETLKLIEKIGDKQIVIFSNFSSALSILSSAISSSFNKRIEMVYGDVGASERGEIFKDFQEGNVDILLLTYGVGNQGLNLTSCSEIILLDTTWNFAEQNQAICRCYRIGQTKEVNVYQLISENTVEERMIALCEEKKEENVRNLNGEKIPRASVLQFLISV